MRREKTLKIVANHLVADDGKGTFALKEHPSSDRSWTYTAQDFSEGETKLTTFAIRFANADSASPQPAPPQIPAACGAAQSFAGRIVRTRSARVSASCAAWLWLCVCRRRQHVQSEVRGVPGGDGRGRGRWR